LAKSFTTALTVSESAFAIKTTSLPYAAKGAHY
jgi:hypothetical protein